MSVPIHSVRDQHNVCRREGSCEESDDPVATMELVASNLEKTRRDRGTVSHVVHLESKYFDETCDDKQAKSTIEVPKYDCHEVSVRSVCSAGDLSECIEALTNLCNRSNEDGVTALGVGDEVEVAGSAQEASAPGEMTGMELLNMAPTRRPDKITYLPSTTSSLSEVCHRQHEHKLLFYIHVYLLLFTCISNIVLCK